MLLCFYLAYLQYCFLIALIVLRFSKFLLEIHKMINNRKTSEQSSIWTIFTIAALTEPVKHVFTTRTSQVAPTLRIHAMDYLSSLENPGRDLHCVELFSGKATIVSSFRSLHEISTAISTNSFANS